MITNTLINLESFNGRSRVPDNPNVARTQWVIMVNDVNGMRSTFNRPNGFITSTILRYKASGFINYKFQNNTYMPIQNTYDGFIVHETPRRRRYIHSRLGSGYDAHGVTKINGTIGVQGLTRDSDGNQITQYRVHLFRHQFRPGADRLDGMFQGPVASSTPESS